jgi:tetratricopeptide (TPR) repeat protein
MNALREMQQNQNNFMQGMLNREYEVRLKQGMEGREREWDRERDEPNIEMMLRRYEEGVERNPGDPELRVELGNIYWKVDNIEAAYRQYKAALEIAPDFGPAYGALEELRAEFPDVSRTPVEKPLKDAAGTVISANKEEIKLEIFEGDALTFKVPFIQIEDESWVPNEDFSEFTSSLQPGMRVKILWEETDCCRIIHKIERIEDEE